MSKHQHRTVLVALAWALPAVMLLGSAVATASGPRDEALTLHQEMMNAYQAGDYEKALKAGEKLIEIEPDDVATMYNIACLHCLLRHKDKAYDWLDKAVEAGYHQADHLAGDDDFKTIRAEKRFRAIVERLREAEEKENAAETKTEEQTRAQKKQGQEQKQDEKKRSKNEQESAQAKQPKKQAAARSPDRQRPLTDQEVYAKVNELTQELVAASSAGKRYKALALALEARILADIGLTNYNVACMYALLGQKDDAFRYLDRAIDLGGFTSDMVAQIENDSDFDKLRNDPRYKTAIKKAAASPGGAAQGEQGEPVDFEWKVIVPKGVEKTERTPLVVARHGYTGNMKDMAQRWEEAARKAGAILLVAQGTYKLDDGHYQWGRSIDDIESNLLDAIEEVQQEYKLEHGQIVLTGFSQGATAAWVLALRNPDVIHGVIPVAGRLDVVPNDLFEDDELESLRAIVLAGANDDEKLIEGCRAMVKRLDEVGAAAKLMVYDNLGHDFPEGGPKELVKALQFVLKK